MTPSEVKSVILTLIQKNIEMLNNAAQIHLIQAVATNNFNSAIGAQCASNVMQTLYTTLQELSLGQSVDQALVALGIKEATDESSKSA